MEIAAEETITRAAEEVARERRRKEAEAESEERTMRLNETKEELKMQKMVYEVERMKREKEQKKLDTQLVVENQLLKQLVTESRFRLLKISLNWKGGIMIYSKT